MLPVSTDKRTIRVLGFDPGSTTFGTAVMDITTKRKSPMVIATETVDATKLFKRSAYKAFIGTRGERDLRILLIRKELLRIIDRWKPDVLIAEAPFMKRRSVTAFEALVEVRCMIRDVVWEIRPDLKVLFIDPIRVKNYIGVSHIKTDKSDMNKAVHAFYGSKQKNNALKDADEHSIDAVAVCNVYYRRDVLGEVVESSRKKRGKNAGKRTSSGKSGQESCGSSGRQSGDRNGRNPPRRRTAANNHGKGAAGKNPVGTPTLPG